MSRRLTDVEYEAEREANFYDGGGLGDALLGGETALAEESGQAPPAAADTVATPPANPLQMQVLSASPIETAAGTEAVVRNWLESDDAVALAATIEEAVEIAQGIRRVSTTTEYEHALDVVRTLKDMRAAAQSFYARVREPAHRTWKQVVAAEKSVQQPVEVEERRLKGLSAGWVAEQQRIRREEEDRLRQEQEAREREQREAEAAAAEAQGATAEAEAIRQAPSTAPPVALPRDQFVPKVEGVSQRVSWKAEVTDLGALVKAVAAGQVPIQALKADTVFIGKQARAMREALAYPGVRVYSEATTVTR